MLVTSFKTKFIVLNLTIECFIIAAQPVTVFISTLRSSPHSAFIRFPMYALPNDPIWKIKNWSKFIEGKLGNYLLLYFN